MLIVFPLAFNDRPHLWLYPTGLKELSTNDDQGAALLLWSVNMELLFDGFSNALKNETCLFHDAINASSSDRGLSLAMSDCISQPSVTDLFHIFHIQTGIFVSVVRFEN